MRRRVLILLVLTLTASFAQAAPPVVKTIAGNPLTVIVGDDTSFQILDSSVPGAGQIFPSDCTTSTADMGIFVRSGGTLVSPNFPEHPCGSATGAGLVSPEIWSPVSITDVTGSGTQTDPFAVVVTDSAASLNLTLTMTVTYVQGNNYFFADISFSSTSALSVDAYLAGDIFLANSDFGVPFRIAASGAVGGQDCNTPPTYTILFVPLTAADQYSATFYGNLWSEIQAGDLNNVVDTTCEDDSAGLEWTGRSISPGTPLVISTAATFGTIPSIAECSAPASPGSPQITVTADSTLPVTATDYLSYSWGAPSGSSPDGYRYAINSDTPQTTSDTSVDFQGPLGLRADVPVTLNVLAFACSPEQDSPVASSPSYSLAAPSAAFSSSAASARVGDTLSFTDTSSPQATSWLWFFGDGNTSTDQNPGYSYSQPGIYPVFLLATNGSGSSASAPQTITVTASAIGPSIGTPRRSRSGHPSRGPDGDVSPAEAGSAAPPPPALSPRREWSLGRMALEEARRDWLTVASSRGAIAYIRIERDGRLVAERRLDVLAGKPTIVDLGAYPGWDHRRPVDVRVVADRPVVASLEETP